MDLQRPDVERSRVGWPGAALFRCSGLAAVLLVLLGGCTPRPTVVTGPEPPAVLVEVPPARWPRLADDLGPESLRQAAGRSLEHLRRFRAERSFKLGDEVFQAGELVRMTSELIDILETYQEPEALASALSGKVRLMRSSGRDGQGEILMTGYYEPVMDARRQPEHLYIFPVYGLPDDLVTMKLSDFGVDCSDRRIVGRLEGRRLVPYLERDVIDFGTGLAVETPVLGWVESLVDVFFLHVQGSGTLRFEDGDLLRAGYAASNGQPYRSIGRLLLDEGLMSAGEMSMQGIKTFLEANPEQRRRVLSHNPSYVFFRPLPAVDGPLGCFEIPLTPGRSIATDRGLFSAPLIGFMRGTLPSDHEPGGTAAVSRFVVNQDTGGAIKGPGRVDVFFGTGDAAGALAGRTKHLGELYLFLPTVREESAKVVSGG